MNSKAFRRSLFGSITRFIGVFFASAAGSFVPKEIIQGGYLNAIGFAAVAFLLMWASEFQREATE